MSLVMEVIRCIVIYRKCEEIGEKFTDAIIRKMAWRGHCNSFCFYEENSDDKIHITTIKSQFVTKFLPYLNIYYLRNFLCLSNKKQLLHGNMFRWDKYGLGHFKSILGVTNGTIFFNHTSNSRMGYVGPLLLAPSHK